MNDLAIRIAELCPDRIRCHNCVDANEIWEWSRDGKFWNECYDNDPTLDLNACHSFEETMTDEECWIYDKRLQMEMMGGSERNGWLWHACAEQRCRAFVKTMEGRSVGDGNAKQGAALDSPKSSSLEE